ncbi:hypothetical protein FJK98_08015 [Micromonospora sp. HM134]|uniref:hypothetical protein n=1 Tax=unclassified Micromonospora TaxID=2617518 RepID=UPI0011984762|nr:MULTISPECIES: hypothetical protein [unclassified Micromonospora]QDY07128.1 hypothetical protein FJK98_08015 [Micromonospora sp. HM134]
MTTIALLTLALAGCGDDPGDERDGGAWADGRSKAPATSEAPPADGAPKAAKPGSTPRESPSTPPFVLPTKQTSAPAARKVVDAFKAAGLTVPDPRDRSKDCGPNGTGVGCAQLLVTDAVAVYVFPDEASATNQTDVWGAKAYRAGAVVLNYLGTRTSAAEQKRYNDVLAKLG